jgi:CBS domain-containing protein
MTANTLLQKTFIESHIDKLPPQKAIFIDQQQTCRAAIELLNLHKIGCLLVSNGSDPVAGIFTERDVVKKLWLEKRSIDQVPVSEIMTTAPQTLKYHASIAKAVYLMHTGGFRHIPVLQRDDSWSIISVTDFIRFIHKKLADRLEKQGDSQDVIVSNNAVDKFLHGELTALKPAKPVVLAESASCDLVIKTMIKNNIGCVVIGDPERHSVTGVFSDRDLVKRVITKKDALKDTTIKEQMTKSPVTLQPTASVLYALSAMTEGKFRHLPIVDYDEKLVGVLSIKNFLNILSGGIVSDLRAQS